MLSFQKRCVYQRSIELLALRMDVIAALPRGNADLADQPSSFLEGIVAMLTNLTTFTSKVALMFRFTSKVDVKVNANRAASRI